jgi:hypothetical protein
MLCAVLNAKKDNLLWNLNVAQNSADMSILHVLTAMMSSSAYSNTEWLQRGQVQRK